MAKKVVASLQKRGAKDKEIYLGSPGNTCQKEITCPKK